MLLTTTHWQLFYYVLFVEFVGIIYFTTGALKGCYISSALKELGLSMWVLVPALHVVLSRHLQ